MFRMEFMAPNSSALRLEYIVYMYNPQLSVSLGVTHDLIKRGACISICSKELIINVKMVALRFHLKLCDLGAGADRGHRILGTT